MLNFFKKILKQANKFNSFVNEYKTVAKEVSLPSVAFTNWGAHLAQEGDSEAALERFKQSASMANATPEAFVNLGILCAKNNDYQEAIKNFKKAIKIDETCAKAWTLLGSALSEIDEAKEAKRAFRTSLKYDARSFQTYLNQGIFLAKIGDVEGALISFKNAQCLNPQDVQSTFLAGILYTQLGEIEEAIEKFKMVINQSPFHSDALYHLAYCYFNSKNYDLALNYAQKSIGAKSQKVENYIIIAECHLAKKEKEQCLQTYDQAQSLGYISAQLMHSWGISLQAFDMWEESISKLVVASGMDLSNVDICHTLSLAYLKLDNREEAYKQLNRILELKPNHTTSLFNMGQLCFKDGKFDEAIEWYKKAVAIDVKLIHIYFNIANAYRMKGETEKAIKYWEKNLEYNPKNTGALLNLANAYSDLGQSAIALRKARSAYLLDKQNPEIVLGYGILLLREQEIYDAREKFEEALALSPDLTAARVALLECQIKSNRPKEALCELEKHTEQLGDKKEYYMLKLMAYLKIHENEENQHLYTQILEVCDKILCTWGMDPWVEKIKEKYTENQNNKTEE